MKNGKQSVIVSACLMGARCRYDGGDNFVSGILRLISEYEVTVICPEVAGGLDIPREPSEIKDGRVVSKSGKDVTDCFVRGAYAALEAAKKTGAPAAVLKARSPSCGSGVIYDGTFSGALCSGWGVCASLLRENGIEVFDEEHVDDAVRFIENAQTRPKKAQTEADL